MASRRRELVADASKWALEAVSGVLSLYRELLEEARASVVRAIDEGIRKDKKAQGDATKIVEAVKQSIDDIETTLDDGIRTVESAFDAIWTSLSEPRYPMPARDDPGRTVGLKFRHPHITKDDFQDPDDWQLPTPG